MYPEDPNRKVGLSAIEYAKIKEKHEQKKDRMYSELSKAVKNRPPKSRLLIGGDFNATSTAACTFTRLRGSKPVPEGSILNKNGIRLHDFVKKHDLAIMNTFWRTKKCQMDTWRHTSGFTKTVDYILCDGLTSSWGTSCRVRSSYDFQTDHFLLVFTINQPFKRADRLHHKPKKPEPDPIKQRNVKELRNCPEYPVEIDRLLSDAEIPAQLDDKCDFFHPHQKLNMF